MQQNKIDSGNSKYRTNKVKQFSAATCGSAQWRSMGAANPLIVKEQKYQKALLQKQIYLYFKFFVDIQSYVVNSGLFRITF